MRLMVILGSARSSSRGQRVADWVQNTVRNDNRFELDYVKAIDLGLPFFNEPASPFSMSRAGQDYTNPTGKAWAERVGAADGFIFLVAEYNHGYTALLKNTIDWVGPEWADKPVGFISYATTVTGGARAVEQLRQVVVEVGLVQVANAIHLPRIEDSFGPDGQPTHPASNENLGKMLNEIVRLHENFSKN